MKLFGRRRKLPAGLRPQLRRGERVLAWARTPDGAAVVATNLGLHLPGGTGAVGWHEIHKASWTGEQLVVTAAELVEERAGYQVLADRPPVTVPVAGPGDLPQVVRTRVTRSVSFSSHHPVPGGGVRVVGRKVPDIDGISWVVRYDEGTDPYRAGVPEATAELVAAHATGHRPAP